MFGLIHCILFALVVTCAGIMDSLRERLSPKAKKRRNHYEAAKEKSWK